MESIKRASVPANQSQRHTYRGPAYFYAFTYADRSDWLLYAAGLLAAIMSGAGFPV